MKSVVLLIGTLFLTLHAVAGRFPEKWAYLMKGEEKYFPTQSSITDVACFSASVDADGHLSDGHTTPPNLPGAHPGTRYHLVVTIPWNSTLAHIYLDPALPFRQRIIDGILARCAPFDGIQIDFESISASDGTAYLNFLAAVRKALPKDKLFSVAVMARWADHKKKNPNDAFDYPFIGMIADRVVVMAYDEHYRGGSPGPIASLPWCEKIYEYALATIPREKLVMGIPLYGRGWQTPTLAKAYKHSEIVDEMRARNLRPKPNGQDGDTYSFQETVTVDVYFETLDSLQAKLDLYGKSPIQGVAFWRISQEPDGLWQLLRK